MGGRLCSPTMCIRGVPLCIFVPGWFMQALFVEVCGMYDPTRYGYSGAAERELAFGRASFGAFYAVDVVIARMERKL